MRLLNRCNYVLIEIYFLYSHVEMSYATAQSGSCEHATVLYPARNVCCSPITECCWPFEYHPCTRVQGSYFSARPLRLGKLSRPVRLSQGCVLELLRVFTSVHIQQRWKKES